MEEDHMAGAHGAHVDEPNSRRKRRRSSVEVIDLSEAAPPPTLRHLPRVRFSPPKQKESSPIYIDAETSSSKPPSNSSPRQLRGHHRNNNKATTAAPISPRRASVRGDATVPTTRRSQWGEIHDARSIEAAANINKNKTEDGGPSESDGFLARRLQAEEEMRAARQRRSLEYRMQELERAEAEAMAAVAAGERGPQRQRQRRGRGRGTRYNNNNNTTTSTTQYEGRRRGGGGGRLYNNNNNTHNDSSTEAAAAAAAAAATAAMLSSIPTTGPRSGPRRRHDTPMGFSEAMSEFFLREAEAEAAQWEQAHLQGGAHGDEDIQGMSDEELMSARRYHRSFGPARRGGGRPREPGSRGGHFSSILSELAALHQAVMGSRSNALPSELLFSDRDFTEADYEALLALDEGVENRKGAKQDVINQLPSERVPRGGGGQAAAAYGDCCICLDRIGAGQVVRKLECSHHFHKGCVDKWLKQKASCPICQKRIGEM